MKTNKREIQKMIISTTTTTYERLDENAHPTDLSRKRCYLNEKKYDIFNEASTKLNDLNRFNDDR